MPAFSLRLRRLIHLFILLCSIYIVAQAGFSWTFSASGQKGWLQELKSGEPNKGSSYNAEGIKNGYRHRPGPENVMYGLKTGANILWNEIPLHAATTFKKWPQHKAYAEIGELFGDEPIFDLFERVPEHVINDDALEKYRTLKDEIARHDEWEYNMVADYDGWSIDRFKNVPMAAHMWEHATPETEWFIIADGDSYFLQDNTLNFLQNYDPKEPWLLGSPAFAGGAFTPEGEETGIWFPHGGSGVITSREALNRLFAGGVQPVIDTYTERAIYHCCGDAIYAIALFEIANVSLSTPEETQSDYADFFQGHGFADFGIVDGSWCYPVLSFHHTSPRELERLYEYEARRSGTVTQSQFYEEFWLPYMVPERQWWDAFEAVVNDPWLYQFTPDSILESEELMDLMATGSVPFESKSACRSMCENIEDCMVWRWKKGLCTVSHSGLLVRGRGVREGRKNWNDEEMWSGWMVERIRERRTRANCDPKAVNQNQLVEGWGWSKPSHPATTIKRRQ